MFSQRPMVVDAKSAKERNAGQPSSWRDDNPHHNYHFAQIPFGQPSLKSFRYLSSRNNFAPSLHRNSRGHPLLPFVQAQATKVHAQLSRWNLEGSIPRCCSHIGPPQEMNRHIIVKHSAFPHHHHCWREYHKMLREKKTKIHPLTRMGMNWRVARCEIHHIVCLYLNTPLFDFLQNIKKG